MKKMSKILCMLLSVAMLLSLAACGSSASTAAKGEANLAAAYDKYLAGFSTNGTNGTLTVALSPDFAPMEFYDVAKSGDAAIVGFDVLLAILRSPASPGPMSVRRTMSFPTGMLPATTRPSSPSSA